MAGLVHVAVGFAAKPLSRTVPLWALIVAAETLDILWVFFSLVGIERLGSAPWTHGLLMSFVWSIFAGLFCTWISRDYRSGILVGGLVFGHWIIDFVTHPMGAVLGGRPSQPDLPLLFGGSPNVGLGLYNHSVVVAYAVEFGTSIVGVGIYVLHKLKKRWAARSGRIPVLNGKR